MKIFVAVILAILAFIFLTFIFLLFTKARIYLSFGKKKEQKFKISVSLSLLGGLIKRDLPLESKGSPKDKAQGEAKEKEDELKFFDKVKKHYGTFLDYKEIYEKNFHKIHRSIHAEKTELNLSFGTGDAASTGIATGAVWAGIYNVVAFVSRIIRITEPRIAVTPLYNELRCEFDGKCIISARIVNLILLMVSIGIKIRKINKKEKAAI